MPGRVRNMRLFRRFRPRALGLSTGDSTTQVPVPPLASPLWMRENLHDIGVSASARYIYAGAQYSRSIVARADSNGTYSASRPWLAAASLSSNGTASLSETFGATRARPSWWANGDTSWKQWRRVPFVPYCTGGRALGSSGRGGDL